MLHVKRMNYLNKTLEWTPLDREKPGRSTTWMQGTTKNIYATNLMENRQTFDLGSEFIVELLVVRESLTKWFNIHVDVFPVSSLVKITDFRVIVRLSCQGNTHFSTPYIFFNNSLASPLIFDQEETIIVLHIEILV